MAVYGSPFDNSTDSLNFILPQANTCAIIYVFKVIVFKIKSPPMSSTI